MEIKEAIKLLNGLKIMTLHNSDILFGNEFVKALNMAIAALEKQEAEK